MTIRISHYIPIIFQYISIIKLTQTKQSSKSGKTLITIVIFSLREDHDRDSHLDRDLFLKGRSRSRFPSLSKTKDHLLTLFVIHYGNHDRYDQSRSATCI